MKKAEFDTKRASEDALYIINPITHRCYLIIIRIHRPHVGTSFIIFDCPFSRGTNPSYKRMSVD